MKEFLRIIGFSLLSSLLIFIGKNDLILNWLVEEKILSDETKYPKNTVSLFHYWNILGRFMASY